MKKYILLLAFLVSVINYSVGQAIGSWKTYPALQISTYNEPANNKIYSLCNGNLFSYNTEDTEVHVYDRLKELHDTQIKFIRHCETTDKLVVVYENGNVDLIYPDYGSVNLKQLKDKNYANLYITDVNIAGKNAYISTNFGIIELDTEHEIFTNTYDLSVYTLCCTANDDFIYVSTSNGFYKGDRTQNLLDKNNWTRINGYTFHQLTFFDNKLIGYNRTTGIYVIDQQKYNVTHAHSASSSFFSCKNNIMILGNNSKIHILRSISENEEISQSNDFVHISYYKGRFWTSRNIQGLQPYQLKENTLAPSLSPIQPNSPVRDYFCNMHFKGNRLLVAGGDLNYNNITRAGTAMFYENGIWHNFSEENIVEETQKAYNNLTSIAQDPQDPDHHFVSSAGHGLYEFRNQKFVHNYDETNSALKTIQPDAPDSENYTRCDALQFDSKGNLWMANTEVDNVLLVLKSDGTWASLFYEELKGAPNCTEIFFDSKERLWMNSKRLDYNGIFALDYNGTIDDTSDDTHVKRKVIINQDGVRYDPYYYYCMAMDLNEQIWVGTSSGLFVIEDPDDYIYKDDFTYTQIKIARNDGTEYADYLLNGVSISAIAIDAANRKWIGTLSDGVYLVSEDGQEILQHFNTENSPLISNEIQSIAVSPQTGEIMIGTYLGLVSYTSDASTPAEELDKNNIHVYPNPVKPDYNGLITVDGLTFNAEVKITSVTGQLIYSGYANGGRFTWNGRNQNGKRVSSGVYNIISTNTEGKKAIVSRLTFIH